MVYQHLELKIFIYSLGDAQRITVMNAWVLNGEPGFCGVVCVVVIQMNFITFRPKLSGFGLFYFLLRLPHPT